MKPKVLVIDDEKNITLVLQAVLEKAGFEVLVCNESGNALIYLKTEKINVIITDLYMPGLNGMEILEYCKKNYSHIPVVVITAYGTVETAVSSLKNGAFDYITKPFDQSELLSVIQKAYLTYEQREKEPISLQETSKVSSLTGDGPQIKEVIKMIYKIAPSPSTVLVLGESGTGKELVAYEIHHNSLRAKKPFIKINCAAIPATLIESELFGYEKGAFTGAMTSKPGRFELAHEGTLFLDEIAEMSLEMQVKLLRVLQEQQFERVGGIHTIRVDTRIITATNKDLATEVKTGKFREDLYYRLNVVPISLPALRDRKEDIETLVWFFVAQFNQRLQKNITSVMPECMNQLKNYNWPGNIRQLENAIERMVLMADSQVLEVNDLPKEILNIALKSEPETGGFKEIVKRQTQSLERELIEKALDETCGNLTKAADKLGLSRKGLQIKVKELGIDRTEFHMES
ncbi:MAG: sigma-54-dependent Fis family transcriptional regulator [Bdellovibrio sp.]|nr:sigma-54-dependent Fis family transcriptional regulator [Bdellovibrio sp.]